MIDGLPLDPFVVLGIPRDSSPEEVREAFHRKSKKHHPDLGGDEWAFRIVVHAYDLISSGAALETVAPIEGKVVRPKAQNTGKIRLGIHDKDVNPSRIVLVEILWMRYDVGDVMELMGDKQTNRQLSGSIQMTWPDPELAGDPRGVPFADRILLALNGAFDEVRAKTAPLKAKSKIDQGRFEAWISYTNGPTAAHAFKYLHTTLKARGLGVRQWTRDIAIARDE
jgi:hypothetical protein